MTEVGESGLLTAVYWQWLGTELALDAAAAETVVFVRNPEMVSVNEEFWIGDTGPYRVTAIDDTAVYLDAPLTIAMEESEPFVPDMGGEPGQAWYAEVVLADNEEPIEVPMTWQDRLTLPEGEYDPPRAVVLSEDLQRIIDIPYQTPTVQYGSITDPPPVGESGNNVYPQDEPPWPNGEAGHPTGELWIETDNDMHNWFWDAVSMQWIDANDPALDLLDDISQLPVGEDGPTLGEIAETVENTEQTATSARNLASTADGRVSMSDYDPVPEDSRYYATDAEGDLLLGDPFTIIGAQLTDGVATLTMDTDNLQMNAGEYIVITGVGAPFDGVWTLVSEVEGSPQFTYRITGQPDIPFIDLLATPGTGYNSIILDRIAGSVWFTRTRSRRNLVTNPSFEVDLSGWAVANCTATRVDMDTFIAGDYVMRVVNDAVDQDHRAEWAGGTPGMSVNPGETYAVTCFGLLEAGQDPLVMGVGCYASVRLYRSDGSFYSEINGEAVTLQAPGEVAGPQDDDWREMQVSATIPEVESGLPIAFMSAAVFHNPNPNAVWYLDGALAEQAEYTGRYFDGYSYDAEWSGTPNQSESVMEGGKIVSVYELYDGDWVRLDFTGTTTYDADASDLTQGTLDPDRIGDRSLDPEKFKTNVVIASEALAPGDFVHIWTPGAGTFLLRKASAGAVNKVLNPSFEVNTSFWSSTGGNTSLARVSLVQEGVVGDYVARVLPTGGGAPGGASGQLLRADLATVPVVPGTRISARGLVSRSGGTAPTSVRFLLLGYNDANAFVRTIASTTVEIGAAMTEGRIENVLVDPDIAYAIPAWYRASGDDGLSWTGLADSLRFDGHLLIDSPSLPGDWWEGSRTFEAHGFIFNSAVPGDQVPVFTVGYNPLCEGLLPGAVFLSPSPGKAQSVPPQSAGRIVQEIGFASDPTTLHFLPQPAILLN